MSETAKNQGVKIKLYWLEQSRAQRILWLLEELGLEYELEIFHRNPKTHLANSDLKAIHALGKSPVLSIAPADGEKPLLIAESGFIVEYLTEHFGKETTLLPKRWRDGVEGKVGGETEEWMRYKYFLHYAEGSLMGFLVLGLVAQNIKEAPVPFFIRPVTGQIATKLRTGFIEPNLMTHFAFLEERLASSTDMAKDIEKKYLCGENLTSADILMSFPLIAARGGRVEGMTRAKFPLLMRYIERLEEESGYKKSVESIVKIEGKFSASL